jgi:rubrerythrin
MGTKTRLKGASMVTVVTKATGGSAKPVGLLYIEPAVQVEDASAGTSLVESGLNAPFVADLLSACLSHERCGVHLYRSVAGRTMLPELRSRYEEFLAETEEHVELLEGLIRDSGGNPMYVSPAARATERADAGLVESTWILDGSIDEATAELAMLEAVLLAEVKDHDNWELLSELAQAMNPGPAREGLESVAAGVLAQEDEHFQWARQTRRRMLTVVATGQEPPPSDQGADEAAEDAKVDVEDATKDELYEAAKQLDIAGRSSMTKEQLAEAVAGQGVSS